jgi:hypothetical protein
MLLPNLLRPYLIPNFREKMSVPLLERLAEANGRMSAVSVKRPTNSTYKREKTSAMTEESTASMSTRRAGTIALFI